MPLPINNMTDEQIVVFVFEPLKQMAHANAVKKGFVCDNDGEQIALMHSELSEGLEAIRKDLMSDHIPEFKGIEEELADTIIRICHYAAAKRLRTAEAILAKMEFNATRPAKHGGKKF